uniref:Spaetzle domain-containing protein n=1 Tax=Anopheles quadriannulatus TaxID=34691 RepID=A0A182WZ90_ANOQN
MKLTLVVCGFLFGLILAPIDGRLKYAEVFPSDAFQKLGDSDGSPVRDPSESGPGKQTEPSEPTDGGPLNCFPLADRLHKYDWARYYLRHLAAGSAKAAGYSPASPGNAEERPEATDGSSMAGFVTRKRSDFNREISTDLYAQYPSSCACQTKYELLDLGYTHFPRYIVNAICQNRSANSRKCWRGSSCKEIPYKVRVLTKRSDNESGEQDHHSTLLPEPLREYWRFKTVTIAAACQCSI